MKVRKHSKRRFSSALAKRQGRKPWTAEGNKAFRLLMQRSRFVRRDP